MKRISAAIMMLLILFGCAKQQTFDVSVVVGAGSTAKVVYSDEEIMPLHNTITLTLEENWADTEVILTPLEKEAAPIEPVILSAKVPAEVQVEKGVWYKIGLIKQNASDKELRVSIQVKSVEVRIPEYIQNADVSLEVLQQNDSLTFTVINSTDEDLCVHDASFRLEKKTESGWESVSLDSGMGFCGNPSTVESHGIYGPFEFESWVEPLTEGEYRLSFIVSDDYSLKDAKEEDRIYTEFVVQK